MKSEEYARMHAFEDWYWWFVARRDAALQFAREYGPRSRPMRVLDAGCGTGILMKQWLRWPEVEATGIDLSPEALDFSRQRGQRRLVRADLTALPFPAGTFD